VIGDAYTNTVEGFFGNLKTGIRGNYKKVSHRWLQGYLNEFTFPVQPSPRRASNVPSRDLEGRERP